MADWSERWTEVFSLGVAGGIVAAIKWMRIKRPAAPAPPPTNGGAILHAAKEIMEDEREALAHEREEHRKTQALLNLKEKETATLMLEVSRLTACCEEQRKELHILRDSAAG